MFKNNMKFNRTVCRINSKINALQSWYSDVTNAGHYYVVIIEGL